MVRISSIKEYVGLERDLPSTLPTGDVYICTDVDKIYKFINGTAYEQSLSSPSSSGQGDVSKRVGEFVFKKSGMLLSDGYLEVLEGTVLNGALDYPIWAGLYPEYIVGNDIVFPSDVNGMFLRNLGGGSLGEGVFQADELKAHTHTYSRPPSNQFTGRGTGSNIARRGANGSAQTSNSGGSETRPKNRAYQLYTIVDTY